MNEIPLVQNVQKNDINTSIIAIKKQLKELNAMLGLIDVPSNDSPDMSPYVRKDEVVDVVRRFDQSPVTSNAVSESLSYSTTEQKTGGVWLDGKPIYKKVVPMYRNGSLLSGFTFVGSGRYTSTVTPRNMERIIINYISVLRQSGVCDTITSPAGNSYGFCTYIDGNVYLNISIGTVKDIDIVLEYTKTTDQAIHLMTTREFIEPMIKEILEEDK